MANRLNVLIGATLAENVEGNLNTELKKLSAKLQAIEIKANFDGDFKKLADQITRALNNIDTNKLNIGKGLSKAGDAVTESFDKAAKSLSQMEKNGAKATKIVEKLDKKTGQLAKTSETISIDYGDGTKKATTTTFKKGQETGKTVVTTDSSQAAIKKQFEATEKQAEKTKDKIVKIYEDISDKFYDAFGEKKGQGIFYEPELKSELQKIDDITNRLKTQQLTLDDIVGLQSELNSLLAKAERFKKTSGYEAEDIKKQIALEEKREKLSVKRYNRDLKFRSQVEADKLKKQIALEEKQEKLSAKQYNRDLKFRSQIDADKLNKLVKQKDSLQKEVKKAAADVEKIFNDIGKGYGKLSGESDWTKFVDTEKLNVYLTRLNKLDGLLKQTVVSTGDLKKAQRELKSVMDGADIYKGKNTANISAQEKSIKNLQSLRERWATEQTKLNAQMEKNIVQMGSKYGDAFDSSKLRAMYDINEKVQAILRRQDATWEQISKEIAECVGKVNLYDSELAASQKQLKKQEAAIKNTKREVGSLGELMNTSMGRFVQFYSFGEMARGVKNAAREIVTEIKTIDDAMVELKKVSNETDYTYNKFLEGAGDEAKKLGVAMSDYIDSVTNFKRMGVSDFGDAQIVAKNANIMQTVSESLTADQASEYLISIMSSYNYEASQTLDIIDKLNNIDRCPHAEMCG